MSDDVNNEKDEENGLDMLPDIMMKKSAIGKIYQSIEAEEIKKKEEQDIQKSDISAHKFDKNEEIIIEDDGIKNSGKKEKEIEKDLKKKEKENKNKTSFFNKNNINNKGRNKMDESKEENAVTNDSAKKTNDENFKNYGNPNIGGGKKKRAVIYIILRYNNDISRSYYCRYYNI